MPPFIPGVSFGEALKRFKLIGWKEVGQEGSHVALEHPSMPGAIVRLPDHRRKDLNPRTLGEAVATAGLTRDQFVSLSGPGYRRNARRIRMEVYEMAE